MMSVAPINTSLYPGLIDSIFTMPSKESYSKPVEPIQGNSAESQEPLDLGNYYANLASMDLLEQAGENVAAASANLESAMTRALENGYSVEQVCNLKRAEAAYKANCSVLKHTIELEI